MILQVLYHYHYYDISYYPHKRHTKISPILFPFFLRIPRFDSPQEAFNWPIFHRPPGGLGLIASEGVVAGGRLRLRCVSPMGFYHDICKHTHTDWENGVHSLIMFDTSSRSGKLTLQAKWNSSLFAKWSITELNGP